MAVCSYKELQAIPHRYDILVLTIPALIELIKQTKALMTEFGNVRQVKVIEKNCDIIPDCDNDKWNVNLAEYLVKNMNSIW